jgi:hypothetical protein
MHLIGSTAIVADVVMHAWFRDAADAQRRTTRVVTGRSGTASRSSRIDRADQVIGLYALNDGKDCEKPS